MQCGTGNCPNEAQFFVKNNEDDDVKAVCLSHIAWVVVKGKCFSLVRVTEQGTETERMRQIVLQGEKMRLERRKFIGVLAGAIVGLSAAGGFAGCGVAVATWIQMGLGLISTILPTIPSLISAFQGLTGKGLTDAQVAKLTAVFNGAKDLLTQAQQLVQQFQASNDTTLITKIQTILTQLKTNLNLTQLLADLQITNASVVTKISTVVNSFIELANDILIILPSVTPTGQVHAKRVTQAQMARIQPHAWAARFNESLASTNGTDRVVDAAFANVKAVAAN